MKDNSPTINIRSIHRNHWISSKWNFQELEQFILCCLTQVWYSIWIGKSQGYWWQFMRQHLLYISLTGYLYHKKSGKRFYGFNVVSAFPLLFFIFVAISVSNCAIFFLDKLVKPKIIALNLILDEVFEMTLSKCYCIQQIFLNCWWCLKFVMKDQQLFYFAQINFANFWWYCSNTAQCFYYFQSMFFPNLWADFFLLQDWYFLWSLS